MEQHTPDVLAYLGRIYDRDSRTHACRANSPEEFATWQRDARPALRNLIGLDQIEESLGEHTPDIELGDSTDMGDYTRQSGILHSEPNVQVPFWLLHPKTAGPYPLGLFPHGHEERGMDTYVDIYPDEAKRQKIQNEDRDVAVQAVRRGYVAIAPTTRGFAPTNIPDINDRHGGRHCRSQLLHCLLGGRTAIGERVWDLERLLDWALSSLDINADRVLMMGNSGGGVATLYGSACDIRVTTAVPSCSFCTFIGRNGLVHHCDCNAVPGILRFGDFYDVAGLIAPRPLLTVNGNRDTLFPLSEVDRAVEGVRKVYQSAGTPEYYVHQYGDGGHRFYSDLMWPFIDRHLVGRQISAES